MIRVPSATLLTVIATTFGTSFRFGYNACLMNPTADVLRNVLNNTIKNHYTNQQPISATAFDWIWALSASILFLGATIGALTLVLFCKNMGRRTGLIISQVIFIIGSLLSASAYFGWFELLVLGQFIVGFALGFSDSIMTPYIDEISDKFYSYILYNLVAISSEVGTSIANFLGINVILGGKLLWPLAFVFPVIFNVICLIIFLGPKLETPVYLLRKGKKEMALKSVQYYFELEPDEAHKKLREIEKKISKTHSLIQKSPWQAITDQNSRRALCMSILTAIIMNFSGILAIIVYGTSLFEKYSQFNNTESGLANFGVFTTSLFGLLFALFVVRDTSHRLLLLIGLPVMLVIDVFLMVVMKTTTRMHTLALALIGVLIISFCLTFSNSIEKVTFFYGAMYTSPDCIDSISSIAVVVTYLSGFVASTIFFPLDHAFDAYSFLMFIIPLAIVWICFFIWYPKDKVKPVKETQSTIEVSLNPTSEKSVTRTKIEEDTKDC